MALSKRVMWILCTYCIMVTVMKMILRELATLVTGTFSWFVYQQWAIFSVEVMIKKFFNILNGCSIFWWCLLQVFFFFKFTASWVSWKTGFAGCVLHVCDFSGSIVSCAFRASGSSGRRKSRLLRRHVLYQLKLLYCRNVSVTLQSCRLSYFMLGFQSKLILIL